MSFIAPLCNFFCLAPLLAALAELSLVSFGTSTSRDCFPIIVANVQLGFDFELDDVFARSNSYMGVTPLLEANLRHPEHSTTRFRGKNAWATEMFPR